MLRRISAMTFALAMTASALPAWSAPLTDALEGVLGDFGSFEYRAGRISEGMEILDRVVFRLEDGRTFRAESMTLSLEGKFFDISIANLEMQPRGTTLLLRADQLEFTGGPRHIERLMTGEVLSAACSLGEGDARVDIEDFGYIEAAPEGSIEEDGKFRIMNLAIRQTVSRSTENCRVNVELQAGGVAFRPSGSDEFHAERLQLDFSMPGSLQSLAADRGQSADFHIETQNAVRRIIGGAPAMSIVAGEAHAEFQAITLVPFMTHALRHQGDKIDTAYLMGAWNSLVGADIDLTFDLSKVFVRTANILPTHMVRRFNDAGLTTLLFSAAGDISASNSTLFADIKTDVTGITNARLVGNLGIETYPQSALEQASSGNDWQNSFPPLRVDSLILDHEDKGLNDALQELIGTQTTVRISQLREKYAEELPEGPADYVRNIATKTANFIARSIQRPPAVVEFEVTPELNLREALIIMKSYPEQIINIFDMDVYSRE